MKKYILLILLIPAFSFGQLNWVDTLKTNGVATDYALGVMVSDSVKNTLADLNVQLSVKLLDSTSLNTEAELETLTGIDFYKAGDDIPLSDGGLGMTSGEKGSLVYFTAGNTLGRKAVAAAGALFSTGADSTIAWITDLPTAMTIGTAYVYRVGGTDVADADIASAATWNARLDSASIIVWSDTTGIVATISDTTILSTRISGKADSGAVGYLDQAETIAGNWVNTTNPWADNEVADNITASSYLPLAGGNMTGDIAYSDPGTSANSKSLIFISDNAGEPDSASIQSMFGDDPYLRFSAPNDAGNLTAIMDLKDQRVVIGAGTAGVDYDLFFNGETNDGIITYDEDNNVFGFNNGVQANHLLVSDATALPAGIATYCPIAVKDDSFMICLDGVTWLHIVTQARATP